MRESLRKIKMRWIFHTPYCLIWMECDGGNYVKFVWLEWIKNLKKSPTWASDHNALALPHSNRIRRRAHNVQTMDIFNVKTLCFY